MLSGPSMQNKVLIESLIESDICFPFPGDRLRCAGHSSNNCLTCPSQ